MQVIVITTCSDRKRFPVSPELNARHLTANGQAAFSQKWQRRLADAHSVGVATDVYGGRSFQEAVAAARVLSADFRIVSGGLGLIRGSDKIPSYSLSLVPKSSDFIGARIGNEPFVASDWWRSVQRSGSPAPLSKLIHRNSDALTLVGISKAYLALVVDDLSLLSDRDLQRVRFVGLGIEKACPKRFQELVLPYDSRLDGPDSSIPGTRGDFASRAMRHFAEVVVNGQKRVSLEEHKAAVRRSLRGWRPAKMHSRLAKTDEEIISRIRKFWRSVDGQSGRGLRYLRDIENIACEQGRFAALFRRVAQEVAS